ncbi:hypothetical protein E2C01_006242 [Portunus trituberculatus]|uniref:Uncharacterized protein n=1 Tax=Portunus trituberculatus TaxID=210409 RepID=A0A5B7CXM5_PORTR|nr:hypothetical protein [Portunus trituberculatus]
MLYEIRPMEIPRPSHGPLETLGYPVVIEESLGAYTEQQRSQQLLYWQLPRCTGSSSCLLT